MTDATTDATAGATTDAMTDAMTDVTTGAVAASWAAPVQEVLGVVAEGVTRVAGFGVAAIGLVRDGSLEIVAVAGDEEARRALLGIRTPLDVLLGELELADQWGPLHFVPHERLSHEPWGWVPDVPVREDVADAWHPLDALSAPLRGSDGELLGLLSIDVPVDGRRPGAEQRRVLAEYADQAARAAVLALEREAFAEQVRLATAAREVIRNAPADQGVPAVLEASSESLRQGFRAAGLWVQLFDDVDHRRSYLVAGDGTRVEMPARLERIAERSARESWRMRRVEVVDHDRPLTGYLTSEDGSEIRSFLAAIGVRSLLFVPIGVGEQCLGNLVLTRADDRGWSEAEQAAALDIGHDLGRVVLTSRAFEREHRTVKELRALDGYKGQLIATVSHELKNPLAAIVGHLEILEGEETSPLVRSSLQAMDRAARRLTRVADDLLLLSRVADPDYPVAQRPVDLQGLAREAIELSAVVASRKHLAVSLEAAGPPAVAMGDPHELDRVVANLLSNAVKYTPEGGKVQVCVVREDDEVVLEVVDSGLGISAADQEQLFSEFFRSTNPAALAQPGTGLGLTIVARIVRRHGGTIEVESELGSGSTFRVRLPAAA